MHCLYCELKYSLFCRTKIFDSPVFQNLKLTNWGFLKNFLARFLVGFQPRNFVFIILIFHLQFINQFLGFLQVFLSNMKIWGTFVEKKTNKELEYNDWLIFVFLGCVKLDSYIILTTRLQEENNLTTWFPTGHWRRFSSLNLVYEILRKDRDKRLKLKKWNGDSTSPPRHATFLILRNNPL